MPAPHPCPHFHSCSKIEEQVAAGEQPYELRTDSADSFKSNRAKPAQKKKKNKASSGKRK